MGKEKWFLGKNEKIILSFENLTTPFYLTNKRVITLKEYGNNKEYKEIGLDHISFIEARKVSFSPLIILGIFLLLLGFILMREIEIFSLILFVAGIIMLLIGIYGGERKILFVSDSGKYIAISLKTDQQLEDIIKTLREDHLEG